MPTPSPTPSVTPSRTSPSPVSRAQGLTWLWIGLLVLGLAWSFMSADRFTWLLEVVPILVAIPILIATRKKFRLSALLYFLILVHAWILMIGGKYTYAEVPWFNWLREQLHLARNPYDGIGHFAQGFVPAILAREILLRRRVLNKPGWVFFLVTSICLAFSACYELLEWAAAATTGENADAFLGTQGDPWDTQKDMLLAGIGAITALLTLARAHDRSMAKVATPDKIIVPSS